MSRHAWSWRHAVWLGLVAVGLAFAARVLRLSMYKGFSVDELTYAHASWAIAHGEIPFEDFFFHHTLLVQQLGALVFLWGNDDPLNVVWLRVAMLPFLVLIACVAFGLNYRTDGRWAVTAPLLVFSTLLFSSMATEFRPDAVAFAFLLASVVVLDGSNRRAARGWLAGALLAIALWTSEKTLIHGSVFAIAFAVDVLHNRRQAKGYLLCHPLGFLLGVLSLGALVALYVTITHSWHGLVTWGLQFAAVHERHYPGHSFLRYFVPFLERSWWLGVFAVVGVAETLRTMGPARARHPDALLLGMLVSTFLSFAMQKAPFPYSLVPFAGLLALFAARGLVACYRHSLIWSRPRQVMLMLAVTLFAGLQLRTAHDRLAITEVASNLHQRSMLAQIGRLTGAQDAIYDNSGTYVSRRHVSFFYFTDATVRLLMADRLKREIPRNIEDGGCVAFLPDFRSGGLAPPLKRFLQTNFQPYNGDIRLWGRRYRRSKRGAALDETFHAVTSGRYFVEPATVAEQGRLTVDGRRIETPVFELDAGPHAIRVEGGASELYILWLPRDGKRYRPRPGRPRFSLLLGATLE